MTFGPLFFIMRQERPPVDDEDEEHWRITKRHLPSACRSQIGPPLDPSRQIQFGIPGAGPHSFGAHDEPDDKDDEHASIVH